MTTNSRHITWLVEPLKTWNLEYYLEFFWTHQNPWEVFVFLIISLTLTKFPRKCLGKSLKKYEKLPRIVTFMETVWNTFHNTYVFQQWIIICYFVILVQVCLSVLLTSDYMMSFTFGMKLLNWFYLWSILTIFAHAISLWLLPQCGPSTSSIANVTRPTCTISTLYSQLKK